MKISGPHSLASNSPQPSPELNSKHASFAPKSAIKGASKAAQVEAPLNAELKSLAAEVRQGKIPVKQASREFVGVMVKEYFENTICEKSQKVIEDSLCEFLDADPQFGARLEKNLKGKTGTT